MNDKNNKTDLADGCMLVLANIIIWLPIILDMLCKAR